VSVELCVNGATIEPGDHVLIHMDDSAILGDRVEEIRDALIDRFPGVSFTFVAGVHRVEVMRRPAPVNANQLGTGLRFDDGTVTTTGDDPDAFGPVPALR
jgi:hypothetical protein